MQSDEEYNEEELEELLFDIYSTFNIQPPTPPTPSVLTNPSPTPPDSPIPTPPPPPMDSQNLPPHLVERIKNALIPFQQDE